MLSAYMSASCLFLNTTTILSLSFILLNLITCACSSSNLISSNSDFACAIWFSKSFTCSSKSFSSDICFSKDFACLACRPLAFLRPLITVFTGPSSPFSKSSLYLSDFATFFIYFFCLNLTPPGSLVGTPPDACCNLKVNSLSKTLSFVSKNTHM